MNRNTIALALAGSLSAALSTAAFASPVAGRKDGGQREVLRHLARRAE